MISWTRAIVFGVLRLFLLQGFQTVWYRHTALSTNYSQLSNRLIIPSESVCQGLLNTANKCLFIQSLEYLRSEETIRRATHWP